MNIYLQRHAQPQPGDREGSSRQLTAKGRKQAEEMAAFMKREVGRVDIIITSPFDRAVDTAKIMAPALGAHIADTRMLQPGGNPQAMWDEITRLAQQSGDVLVIGHHPSIVDLAAWLIGGTGAQMHFQHGAIAMIDMDAELKEAAGEYYYDDVEQKRWVLGAGGASGENCETCEENADAGWIDMDDTFLSTDGDDIDDAPAHPNCECEVEQKTRRVRMYAADRAPKPGVRLYEASRKPSGVLHWFACPRMVERDAAAEELAEAAMRVAEAILL